MTRTLSSGPSLRIALEDVVSRSPGRLATTSLSRVVTYLWNPIARWAYHNLLNPTAIGTERSGRERADALSVLFIQQKDYRN